MILILKVVSCGEPFTVKSEKNESGVLHKRNIVLKVPGGKYEDTFVATMLGSLAQCQFYENDLVMAVLRFSAREYNGQTFQDIIINDIYKIKS